MKTVAYNSFINDATKNARENDTPISGSFELTPLCNLDCKMCYIHLNDPTVKDRMLTGDQWIDLMGQAIGHGMIKALLTGGEVMTHPDFRKIYMYLIEQGVSVYIKTNGILLNREMIDLFVEYPPFVVDVSLYGCDGASYRAVTGHDVFDIVTANVRAAIAAGLHIRLMVTSSAYMLPWVDRIMEYAKTFGVVQVIVNDTLLEARPNTGRHMEDFGLSLEENARIYRKQWDMFARKPNTQTKEEAEFMGEIPEDAPHILPRGLYCNGGRTTFAMYWDGVMVPCLNFPRDVICADVKRIRFEKAWRGVNQGVKEYVVPEECRTCTHNTQCHYCPTQHKDVAARRLCNPDVCAWRRLHADIAEEYRVK